MQGCESLTCSQVLVLVFSPYAYIKKKKRKWLAWLAKWGFLDFFGDLCLKKPTMAKKMTTAKAIAQTLQKARKKKKLKLSKSLEKKNNINQEITTVINEINSLGYDSDLKSVITTKEYQFVSNYLSGGVTIIQAMKSAGYIGYNEDYLYRLGRKIVQKIETQAEDCRKIARAIGAGEVFILKTLYSLAKDSKSEKIRGDNAMNLAKLLGLTKEQIDGAGGLTIIFEGAGTPGAMASLPGAPPMPASQGELKALPASKKPMMITK